MAGSFAESATLKSLRFDKLHEVIPYAVGGKAKILKMSPYNGITLAMPGRHSADTTPVGGDFVVMVDDENMDWVAHQFTHTDIFLDIELKKETDPDEAEFLMRRYADVVCNGDDPEKMDVAEGHTLGGIHPKTFLYAVQALAVAEHRRYAKYENKYGGRYLPLRFSAGITEGLWKATDAIEKQRMGRPGVEWLEKDKGVPYLTSELMK